MAGLFVFVTIGVIVGLVMAFREPEGKTLDEKVGWTFMNVLGAVTIAVVVFALGFAVFGQH